MTHDDEFDDEDIPDRARVLAKEALADVRKIAAMAACVGEDATGAQELAISHAIRKYFIERMEKS